MPLYEYECVKCDKVFEIQHSIAELDEERLCGCKSAQVLERKIASSSFKVKGGTPKHHR
jgi:putative FmdB family regulatory protein